VKYQAAHISLQVPRVVYSLDKKAEGFAYF
jgi:hypothetical protein